MEHFGSYPRLFGVSILNIAQILIVYWKCLLYDRKPKNIISCILLFFLLVCAWLWSIFIFFNFKDIWGNIYLFVEIFYYGKFQKHIKIEIITVQQNFMDLLHNINHLLSGASLVLFYSAFPISPGRLRQT